jgi:hypothetical protein
VLKSLLGVMAQTHQALHALAATADAAHTHDHDHDAPSACGSDESFIHHLAQLWRCASPSALLPTVVSPALLAIKPLLPPLPAAVAIAPIRPETLLRPPIV